jgi:hypothetical protein
MSQRVQVQVRVPEASLHNELEEPVAEWYVS